MRIKGLFTVPEGEKVTEKTFGRVLISSVCSIVLCMLCLVSTTWAWFAVSVENTGNVINIGKPEINLSVNGSPYESGSPLTDKELIMRIVHANSEDDFQKKSTLYVTLTIQSDGGTTTLYTILDEGNNYNTEINIQNSTEKPCSFSWSVSWFAPVNAAALSDNTITLNNEKTTVPSTENTTDATTAPTQATTIEPSTEAVTEPSTEGTTSPITEPSTETNAASTESTGNTDGVE